MREVYGYHNLKLHKISNNTSIYILHHQDQKYRDKKREAEKLPFFINIYGLFLSFGQYIGNQGYFFNWL